MVVAVCVWRRGRVGGKGERERAGRKGEKEGGIERGRESERVRGLCVREVCMCVVYDVVCVSVLLCACCASKPGNCVPVHYLSDMHA